MFDSVPRQKNESTVISLVAFSLLASVVVYASLFTASLVLGIRL